MGKTKKLPARRPGEGRELAEKCQSRSSIAACSLSHVLVKASKIQLSTFKLQVRPLTPRTNFPVGGKLDKGE
jgi:hypothetical protein